MGPGAFALTDDMAYRVYRQPTTVVESAFCDILASHKAKEFLDPQ